VKTAQGGNDLHAFFSTIFGQKPPRRFREPDHENADNKAENDLEGNGKTPSQVRRSICASKIKPVCDESTESNDAPFNANEQTTVSGLRALRLVGRNRRGVDTVSETGHRSTDDKLCCRLVPLHRSYLDNDPQDHNNSPKDHCLSASQTVSKTEDENCT